MLKPVIFKFVGALLVFAVFFGMYLTRQAKLGTKVAISKLEVVYYKGQATEADAKKLGEVLKRVQYFDGTPKKRPRFAKTSKARLFRS